MQFLGYLDAHAIKLRTVLSSEIKHIEDPTLYLRSKLFTHLGEAFHSKVGELAPILDKAKNFEEAIQLVKGKTFERTGECMEAILVHAAYQRLMFENNTEDDNHLVRIPEILEFCRLALRSVGPEGVASMMTWKDDPLGIDHAFIMLRTFNRPSAIFRNIINHNFWRSCYNVELYQVDDRHILFTDPDRIVEHHAFEANAFLERIQGNIKPYTSIPNQIVLESPNDGLDNYMKHIKGWTRHNLSLAGFPTLSEEADEVQYNPNSTVPALRQLMTLAPLNVEFKLPHAAHI